MEEGKLRRYTDVASVLDMVSHRRINLLDPSRWADRNDAYGLERYRAAAELDAVYVLCMTEGQETWHHWQVFASGAHGACVVFKRDAFLESLSGEPELLSGPVNYCWLSGLSAQDALPLEDLPFLKRAAFKDECEYRLIKRYRHRFPLDRTPPEFESLPLALDTIDRIVLNPMMPRALQETVQQVVSGLGGGIRFASSTLPDSRMWRGEIDRRWPKREICSNDPL